MDLYGFMGLICNDYFLLFYFLVAFYQLEQKTLIMFH